MIAREDLFDRSLDIRSRLLLPLNESHEADSFVLHDIEADLQQLRYVPRPDDPIDELHMLYLARCRLIQLDNYRIVAFLGAGQKGSVFRAIDTKDGSQVAIKLLVFPRNEEEIFRFRQEPEILRKLDHPCIIEALTGVQKSDYLAADWFAMELVKDAVTVETIMKSDANQTFPKVMARACEGLQHAHDNGVVHRDIQPKNILIDKDGNAKILDFGCAHFRSLEMTFRPIGTLTTSAPEVFDNPKYLTGKADVFSIGTMLFRWRYGEWPFYSDSFSEVIEKLRGDDVRIPKKGWAPFEDLLGRTLTRDPEKRVTAGGLAAGLSALVT